MKSRAATNWQRIPVWLYIVAFATIFFILLPILIVIPMSFTSSEILRFPPVGFSFKWYEKFFSNPKWLNATWVSIRVAAGTTVCSCALGILAALGLSRKIFRRSKGFRLLLMAPMMLPSVIVAVSMYLVFGQWKLIGTFGGIILGHTCLAIPYVVTLMSSALMGLDPRQYDAARSLGADHFTAVRKVVIPQVKTAILSSMLFAFITSFDESVLVLFLTKTKTITLPRMIYAELRYGISPALAAVSTLLITVTLFVFILSRVLAKMRPDARALRMAEREEKARRKAKRSDSATGDGPTVEKEMIV